ncbi:MAG TPA: TlpA disulfide reductase family protein [Acidimicrobiia bacterium]
MTGVFVLVITVGLVVGAILRDDQATAAVGGPAPDFTVEVIDGGSFTLSDQIGAPVVLNFWASWCEPCRTEIPAISAFAEAHPDVVVIGVSAQDAELTAREFADEVAASYPLALGTEEIEDAYPLIGLPATYVIDENGFVVEFFDGIIDEETLDVLFDDI